MTNQDIAKSFQELGRLMELHGENPFKIRSYQNAYRTLRKLDAPLSEMPEADRNSIKGVGSAISAKIQELLSAGRMQTLEKYRSMTPEGVREMLQIAGFGPKKVQSIWRDLGVETIGELLYAVNENRLIELKGFGEKTQADLKKKLEYYQLTKNQFHYATLEEPAQRLLAAIEQAFPDQRHTLVGGIRRHANVVEAIELQTSLPLEDLEVQASSLELTTWHRSEDRVEARYSEQFPVWIYASTEGAFGTDCFLRSATASFLSALTPTPEALAPLATEEAVFEQLELPFIPAELRESEWALDQARRGQLPNLVEPSDIRGVVHSHTTYSDGLHSLREMAEYARTSGYEYILITDHSKAAFYANGLSVERVLEQFAEIDALNEELAPFRILKGTECDILADGQLDYDDDLLAQFDVVIASIHSNLRMDQTKATARLLRAIEHPYTHILGHPTGRLLLSRPGYPIDHRAVIEACAEHRVAIELNANPYRLDLDWTWIPYATELGVPICINPDAHSREGIHDIHFGVLSARKGGLTAEQCLNTRDTAGFLQYFH